jgi:hypothetical protein
MGVTARETAAGLTPPPTAIRRRADRPAPGAAGTPRGAIVTRQPSSLWIGAVILAILGATLAPLGLLLPKVPVRGLVRDAQTAEPISGARVQLGQLTLTTDTDGVFDVERASLADSLRVDADGYESLRTRVWPRTGAHLNLVPRRFTLHVRDAETGEPIPAPEVGAAGTRASIVAPGRVEVEPARVGTTLALAADGFRDAAVKYRGGGEAVANLQPRIRGVVVDQTTGQPIGGAHVTGDGLAATTQSDGMFELERRPAGPLRVLAPGYRRAEVDASQGRELGVQVEPFQVRALYLTYYGVGDRNLRENVLSLTQKTDVNAVVIDVKGDRGKLTYRSAVPLAEAVGANDAPTVTNAAELLASLKQRGLYTIARIAVFKDDTLARNGPRAGVDVAIKERLSDRPWTDGENLGWVDPLRPEVWAYNIDLAREAALLGFDEIQFDYARFPVEAVGGAATGSQARYSRLWITEADRVEAIGTFLRRASDEVRQAGAFVGADVVGSVAWTDGDNGVGHELTMLAQTVDYLCPTVYPSSFQRGLPGLLNFPQVVQQPYAAVFESVRRTRARTAETGAIVRPWLQYFDDYAWQTGRAFRTADIDAQRQGAMAAGATGWMMWDPSNKYARGGLGARP